MYEEFVYSALRIVGQSTVVPTSLSRPSTMSMPTFCTLDGELFSPQSITVHNPTSQVILLRSTRLNSTGRFTFETRVLLRESQAMLFHPVEFICTQRFEGSKTNQTESGE